MSGLAISVIIVFVVIPLLINFLFQKQAPVKILAVSWEAADALNYTAGALAFLGTMFLGWVSWSQNNQLQRIETNSFIAQNSCMVLLKSISFKGFDKRVVNLDTEHIEPIVVEEYLNGPWENSFSMNILMKRLDRYATFVRVKSLTMCMGEQVLLADVFAKACDEAYSRIAISENTDRFPLTVIINPATKQKILEALQRDCEITVEIIVELVTSSYVWTKIKCIGKFSKDTVLEGKANSFSFNDQDPVCFLIDNEIIDPKSVKFRNDTRCASIN